MVNNPTTTHIRAELARIDILIGTAIQRWQLAGQDPLDAFRGLYISDDEALALNALPPGASWGSSVNLSIEAENLLRERLDEAESSAARYVSDAGKSKDQPRLARLVSNFSLSAAEKDILLIALAGSLDLRYERLFGYLQDDVTRKRPTPNLALNLILEPNADRLSCLRMFLPTGRLIGQQLISLQLHPSGTAGSLLGRSMEVDETVLAWLLGSYEPSGPLAGAAQLAFPKAENGFAEADQKTPGLKTPGGDHLHAFQGPDLARHRAAARRIAIADGRPLLTVSLEAGIERGHTAADMLGRAVRDARLTGAALYLEGWDATLNDGEPDSGLLKMLIDPDMPVVLSSDISWIPHGLQRRTPIIPVNFSSLSFRERRACWIGALGNLEIDPGVVDHLAGQFQLTSGQIEDAALLARDLAAADESLAESGHIFAAARAVSNPKLSTLARKIEARYSWDDIVLPGDQVAILRELLDTVVSRPIVLDEWGVGRKLASSRGVTALFAGPPGTGKTMAAEILSAALELDLFKIDLSSVISKYIGETEKNLERIFREASSSNAILFFDEADALFGKRSEVRDSHDRYANIEISYLLQRMEAYDGVTILATNLRANLDEAFTRRLHFSVEFPFPEAPDRLRIWKALFPPDVPSDPGLDFQFLAERFKLAGGNIRNIIVSAAYLAASDGGRVTMSQLLHGTRRELQKMGRLVDEAELAGG